MSFEDERSENQIANELRKCKIDLWAANEALMQMSKNFVQKQHENQSIKESADKAVKSAAKMVDQLEGLLLELGQKFSNALNETAKEHRWDSSVVFELLNDVMPSTLVTQQKMDEIKKNHVIKK